MNRLAFAAFALALPAAAPAQDAVTLDVPTAVEKWTEYAGQTVTITGGHVSGAKAEYDIAVLGTYGKATLPIDLTGVDPAVKQQLEADCGKPNTDAIDACAYTVTATLAKHPRKDKPQLTAPVFAKP